MVAELMDQDKYGVVEYLWFDHHGNPVNSTSPFGPWCPHMCDPMSDTLWSSIDETVAKYSKGLTLRGGADLNLGPTSTPKGDEALWLACDTTDGTVHTRPTRFSASGKFFRPSEITNMLTSSGWFHHPSTKPLSKAEALRMIWDANRKGYAFIGNLPPNAHGMLDDSIVAMAAAVGDSIRRFWGSSVGEAQGACTGDADTVTPMPGPPEAPVGRSQHRNADITHLHDLRAFWAG